MVITQLLHQALSISASDIFVTEGKKASYRIRGDITESPFGAITKEDVEHFFSVVLSTAQRKQLADDGDLDVGYSLDSAHRFRINIGCSQGMFNLVIRPVALGRYSVEELGLPKSVLDLVQHKSGILLVTGATGSGKSTTLAALVHHLNSNYRYHIVTIEDPIEFVHTDIQSRITQREVGADTVSFHEGLRRVVRQSPDVIMIGEMRDKESIEVAMAAALTGHLVLATLHTIDASQTLQRLMSYFPEHSRAQVAVDLSLSLRGILSQRLLPKKDATGRVLATELLSNSPAVAQLLRERDYSGLEDILRGSRVHSMYSFNRSLVELTQQGAINVEIATAYSTNPDEFLLLLQGMGNSSQAFTEEGREQQSVFDMKRLLHMTIEKGGSDLHLTVGRHPLVRIHGEIQSLLHQNLSAMDMRMLLNSVMNSRQRMVYELEKEVDFSLGLGDGQRFRVNAYFQKGAMAAALRSIPSTIPNPEDMYIPKEIMNFCTRPHGLILVVGPTGSGKSTTLACMLDQINKTRTCRIITVEDPIEFTHKNILSTIDQREVYADTKSFASALKYILRQDPDVILVGEMRDQETISAALTAAETGHLVFATLHTNDATQTIDRIIDVFPSAQQDQVRSQLAASLQVVISQRLLRKKGNTGRMPVFEIMVGNNAIRNMIRDNKMHQALGAMEAGRSDGMVTMDRALQDAFRANLVDKEEAMRFAKNPLMFK